MIEWKPRHGDRVKRRRDGATGKVIDVHDKGRLGVLFDGDDHLTVVERPDVERVGP